MNTKKFDVIPVEDYGVVVDKERVNKVVRNEWYYNQRLGLVGQALTVPHDDADKNVPIIATFIKRIEGLPLIELRDQEESLESKVLKTVKNALVRGQQFELAGIFRDAQRDSQKNKLPVAVELEMEDVTNIDTDATNLEDYQLYVSEGLIWQQIKITNPETNTIKPMEVYYV